MAKTIIKPSKETILAHVEKLSKLAKKHGGKLPTYSWLNANGYFRSYEVMRNFPHFFKRAGLVKNRAFANKAA
jgi:hypothetical protein